MAAPNRVYMSNGQVLETPPLATRISRSMDDIYNFLGLYFVSLLSFDPYTAAQASQFNTRNNANNYANRARWGQARNRVPPPPTPGSGAGPATRRQPPPAPDQPRRMGTVDDVRGPECGSCQ